MADTTGGYIELYSDGNGGYSGGVWYEPYPLSPFTNLFPDNGLITTDYDKRVSMNDRVRIGGMVFHERNPYETETALDGSFIYHWDPDFITVVQYSFANNKYGNFTKQGMKLFNSYLTALNSGTIESTGGAVLALDTYLGSL